MVEQRRAMAYSIALGIAAATALATSNRAAAAEDAWELITDERLLNPEPGDWLSYRRTYDVTGFSPLKQINRRNVGSLRPVWSYTVCDNSRWTATPIVANGLMYVAEGSGRVLAFDVPVEHDAPADLARLHERLADHAVDP